MFAKILVANRGEIAVRVLRACRDLGITGVAVYAGADRAAAHVQVADAAEALAPPASGGSPYLSISAILDAARRSGATAIHPGYGFLSENPEFAAACSEAGITFIGPEPETMAAVGDKIAARRLAHTLNVPILAGTMDAAASLEEARAAAERAGYPVMLKAAAGGGGKGMRRVNSPAELESALALAAAEAQSAFGSGAVFIERALDRPRHVEIQIFGDRHGRIVWLGERECSVQRRHQKILEESPAPHLSATTRRALGEAAVTLARAANYSNAGTVEFLVDSEERFYFLEVNARLQVEHPVTEMVTGFDLVGQQIRVAAGLPLEWEQQDVAPRGHAIECRIYAEDPATGFLPSPGCIEHLQPPAGPGIREDSGVYPGWTVPLDFDPLLSKLIVWGEDRPRAIARLRRALDEYRLDGIGHNLGFFRRLVRDPQFLEGRIDTGYTARLLAAAAPAPSEDAMRWVAAAACLFAADAGPAHAGESAVAPESPWQRAARTEGLRRQGA